MKKLILLLAIAVFAVSCEDSGPISNVIVEPFRPAQSDWQFVQATQSYAVTYDFPALTNRVLENSTIVAYVEDGNYHDMLPRIRHNTNGVDYWTSTVDFTLGLRSITFFYTNSNFVYLTPPPTMNFRVVVTVRN